MNIALSIFWKTRPRNSEKTLTVGYFFKEREMRMEPSVLLVSSFVTKGHNCYHTWSLKLLRRHAQSFWLSSKIDCAVPFRAFFYFDFDDNIKRSLTWKQINKHRVKEPPNKPWFISVEVGNLMEHCKARGAFDPVV